MATTASDKPSVSAEEALKRQKKQAKREVKLMQDIEAAKKDLKKAYMSKRITRTIALIMLVGMGASAAIAARAITRAATKELKASLADPATDYESALARFARLQAQEAAEKTLNPVCYA